VPGGMRAPPIANIVACHLCRRPLAGDAQGFAESLLDSQRLLRRRGQRAVIRYFDQQPSGEIHKTAQRKVNDHLMMLEPLATLDRAEVSQEAIMAVAHAREPAVSELAEHIPNMHLAAAVSNLDGAESGHIPCEILPTPARREQGASLAFCTARRRIAVPPPARRKALVLSDAILVKTFRQDVLVTFAAVASTIFPNQVTRSS